MRVHPWHDVPLSKDPSDWFPVLIEIPKGSKVCISGYRPSSTRKKRKPEMSDERREQDSYPGGSRSSSQSARLGVCSSNSVG